MNKTVFAMYLEFCIHWNADIRDASFTDSDRRWKQGQIDMLQTMVDEIDGIVKPSWIEEIFNKELIMSQGKYSPICPPNKQFIYNCYGKPPAEWSKLMKDHGVEYDEKLMFDNYDDEGFDSYGYSAFSFNGEYVGPGNGVDRLGYTEFAYLIMDPDDWDHICWYKEALKVK